MGSCPSTDMFESYMVLFLNRWNVINGQNYLDDIFFRKGYTFDKHLEELDRIFTILQNHGRQVNLNKNELCCFQVEFMGFLLKKNI